MRKEPTQVAEKNMSPRLQLQVGPGLNFAAEWTWKKTPWGNWSY